MVITVLTGPIKSHLLAKVYLLSDFSGVAVTQLPTEGDEKVAFMATVGSTQRVISRSCKRCLVLRWVTSSKVRTKCHMPFRKLGPPNPPSALAWDENGPIIINATKIQKHLKQLVELANRLEKLISKLPPIVGLA